MPYIQFQHRRGTAATWTSNNPVLASGEMGIETDSQLFKMGDGTTAWTSLGYGGLKGATGPTGTIGPTGPSTNPATWAAYPASAAINAGGYAITNASSVNGVSATPTTNTVTTVAGVWNNGNHADGVGTNAGLQHMAYMSPYDSTTGLFYFTEWNQNYVRTYNPVTNVVGTLAGNYNGTSTDGTGGGAYIQSTMGTPAVGPTGGVVYFQDGFAIRKCTLAGVVTTIAGVAGTSGFTNGTGTNALFNGQSGVYLDPTGSNLYITDTNNNVIRILNLSTNVVTTWATTPSTINGPKGGGFDSNGNFYVLAGGNPIIQKITPAGVITTVAGGASIYTVDGVGTNASFCGPYSLTVDNVNNLIYVVEGWVSSSAIRRVDMITWAVTSITGGVGVNPIVDGIGTSAKWNIPYTCSLDPTSSYLIAGDVYALRKMTFLKGSGGILPYNGSLYTSNLSTALTVQAPLSYRYVTSNVAGTTVDLTASSNVVGTTFRLTAGPSNTITFPSLSSATSGAWWTFSNAYTATQTLTLAGTTTGLTTPYSLSSNTSLTIYSDGSSYRTVTSGAVPSTIGGVTLSNGQVSGTALSISGSANIGNVSGSVLGTMAILPPVYGFPLAGIIYSQVWCSSTGQYVSISGDDYIRTSSNYGVTWTVTTQGMGGQYPQFAMSANGAVIAATSGSPLAVSTNYGATWSNTPAFNGGNNAVCVSSNGSVIYAAGNGPTDIWVSSNSGATWTQTTTIGAGVTTNRYVYLSCSSNGSVVLAQSQSASTVVSSNYGSTWTTTALGGTNYGNSTVSPDGLTIYSAAGSYPSVSSNNGATFSNLSNAGSRSWSGPPMINSNASVVIIPQGSNLWIATGSPVNTSSTWTSVTTPVTFVGFLSCSYDGNFIVGRQVPGYVWTSPDRGVTWTQRKSVASLASIGYPMYGGISTCSFDGSVALMGMTNIVSLTTNAGQTWSPVANSSGSFLAAPQSPGAMAVSSNGTKIVLVDSSGSPYISSNTGSTWAVISGISANSTIPVAISADGNVILVNRPGNAGINLSTNGGSSWSTVGTATGYYSFAASSNGLIQLAGGSTNAYISSNSGSTWTTVSGLAATSWVVAISYDGVRMVAGQASGGYIWWSANSGVTWTQSTSSGSQSWAWISMSADGIKCVAAPGSGNNGAVSTSLDGGVTWAVTGASYGRSYGACISGDGSIIYGAPYYGGTAPYSMPVKLTIANHSSSFATISNLTAPTILGSGANSNVTVTGNELIVYPGSTNTSNYGAGYDTLTLKTTTEAYGGGVASLAFANSNTGYPLGRIYAVDTGTVPTGSSSSLVFQSAVSNKLVPAMTITGSNVTLSGTIGGVTLSGGAINNVPATPTLYNVTTVSSSLPANIGIASAYDASTGSYYVAYNNGTTVYKITSAGVVTVFAGNGSYSASVNGTGTNASLNVKDMLCDAVGNIYFVENGTSSAIRKITPAGVVTTLAGSPGLASTVIDGTGTNARFNYYVYGLCIDTAGTFLYAADWAPGNILRKINISTAEVTTITFTPSWYGGGFYPCWDATTGTIIGVSTQFYRITTSGATTLLTSSTGIQANDACIDANGNIYAVDYNYGGGGLIWKYTTATNTFVVIAGNNTSGSADGLGTAATFSTSASGTVAVDPSGNIYVGDNGRVRKLTPLSGSGGILPFNNSLYTSNSSTALTVQAPFSCAKTISIQQIQETLNTIASPGSGTVVADWSTGDIWYVTSMTANFTINLTNLPTTANKSYSVVFTLVQGATPYYISALQIAGVAQTIKWPGASAPTATASRVETETFTLMYTGSAWTVLGQLTSFG